MRGAEVHMNRVHEICLVDEKLMIASFDLLGPTLPDIS